MTRTANIESTGGEAKTSPEDINTCDKSVRIGPIPQLQTDPVPRPYRPYIPIQFIYLLYHVEDDCPETKCISSLNNCAGFLPFHFDLQQKFLTLAFILCGFRIYEL